MPIKGIALFIKKIYIIIHENEYNNSCMRKDAILYIKKDKVAHFFYCYLDKMISYVNVGLSMHILYKTN